MNISILYYSRTGNSKRIAQAIAQGLGLIALDSKEKPMLKDVDLLFVIGGIYGGESNPIFLNYLSEFSSEQVKKAVLVTSSAGGRTKQDMVRKTLGKNGIFVMAEEFVCRGRFLIFYRKHPTQQEIDAAVDFAVGILNK